MRVRVHNKHTISRNSRPCNVAVRSVMPGPGRDLEGYPVLRSKGGILYGDKTRVGKYIDLLAGAGCMVCRSDGFNGSLAMDDNHFCPVVPGGPGKTSDTGRWNMRHDLYPWQEIDTE